MTRITNFGRKRTYLESSTDSQGEGSGTMKNQLQDHAEVVDSGASAPPPKKKRKRTPKSKRDGHGTRPMGSAPDEETKDVSPGENALPDAEADKPSKSSKKEKKKKERKDKKYVSPSERRRLQRIAEKNTNTICFACREKGHAARDCPTNENGDASGSKQVGMCYRCGSTRHTLSRCKKPEDPLNPLPHASCFVCNGKGHLASACPQNAAKGIYPNGGSCKLCGDITHLAKDCGIRKKDTGSLAAVLGIEAKDVGADEDDFHTIGRKKQELDRNDQHTEKLQRSMNVKVGAHSGVVKPFGKTLDAEKKVVFF